MKLIKTLGILSAGAMGGMAGAYFLQTNTLMHAQAARGENRLIPAAPEGLDRFEQVAKHIAPTVVAVDAVKPPNRPRGKTNEESGSGVLIRLPNFKGTLVVTNNHVVTGAAAEGITVTLSDGLILRPSQVWADPESDIALLKLDRNDLPVADLGDSDRCRPGQMVAAFGSPFGFNQTVTMGIISARDRGQISLGNTIRIKEFLQTDAAINPGSSGGPLVDIHGNVIGINTAIASNSGTYSGVAFSIPINLVKRIGVQLLERGFVTRGYVGMQLAPQLEPNQALKLGLERARGALVESVYAQGPAAAAGLRAGDVVLKLESVEVRDENHIINMISAMPPNQKVRFTVWRDRRAVVLDVTVGEWQRPTK